MLIQHRFFLSLTDPVGLFVNKGGHFKLIKRD